MNHPNSCHSHKSNVPPIALSFSLAALFIASSLPAFAQLPPVNMGRWVKQPGDNQYSSDTQQSRHGSGQPVRQIVAPQTAVMPQQSAPMWRPTPKAFRSDVSLDPIVCDEPIPPVGFAPLPESLDLPGIRGGSSGFTRSPAGGYGGGGGGGGFSSSYQGSAPGMGGGGNAAPEVRSSQGYNSVQPGAFVKKKTPYGAANNNPPGSFKGGGDVYSSGDGAAPMSEAQRQMSGMGREPGLSNKSASAPEAPAAVQINQATTQDLSLPDDEYKQSKGGNKSTSQAGKMVQRMARRAGRSILQPLNSMPMPRFPMK
ncbi:hypothetical protein KBI23_15420 [bacterium]|nr:hypothetical protein [bacterium]MBP9806915.1 hypothetical protein [bacterium]